MTAAFALAVAVVLLGAGVFVYVRLQSDLSEAVDTALGARSDAVAAVARRSPAPRSAVDAGRPAEAEDGFAQVLAPGGRLLAASGGAQAPALTAAEARRAAAGRLAAERVVTGVEGTTRILARPVAGPGGTVVVAVGQSLEDRDDTLSGLVTTFLIAGPVAILVASGLGYLLAAAGLAPIEAMRRRAREVSLRPDGGNLPLPEAHDEVRRLGETLNEMLDRMRRTHEREGRFVADASHELRTPVAVLKTELEAALRTGDHGPESREALLAAVEECDHLAQLTEDLLVLARAADGALPVRPERLGARSALERVRLRFADRARHQGRVIRVEADADLPVRADPVRLGQALGNLVDNALRHGRGDVVIGARAVGGGVEIEVADAGPGFAADIADGAFERFTRGDAARTRGGAGLGLAIVRAVAEAHGGTAEVGPGPGTSVRMLLPDPGA